MKIKNWHLIVLPILVFLLDFFTLGNRQVIDNPITNKIAFVIGLLCLLVFIFGIIKILYNFFSRNKEVEKIKRQQEEEQGVRATGVEIGFRRLLAVLLLISVFPIIILIPTLGLILSLPNLFLAMYLLLNHRYHLVFNCFLVLLGCLLYFVNFSGNISFFSLYKTIELSVCPGLISPIMAFIVLAGPVVITKYFFLTASLFLLVGDIISRSKPAHKRMVNVVVFIIICLVLLALPYLYVPQITLGQGHTGGTSSFSGTASFHFSTNNVSYYMSYDQTNNVYLFTANMANQDNINSASITDICVDGKIIPVTKENSMLQVDNGVISDGKILVRAGQTATIKLVSQKPFYTFNLFEGTLHYSTDFLK